MIVILTWGLPIYAQEGDLPDPIEFNVITELQPIDDMVATPDTSGLTELTDLSQHSDIYNYLSTAVAAVNSLPDDLSMDNNGTSLLPAETATQLMGYAKWMFSGTSANELLGATLAPIGIELYILLTMIVFMAIAWITVKIALMIFNFVQYIVAWILRALPFVG